MQYIHKLKEKLINKKIFYIYIILVLTLLVSCGQNNNGNNNSDSEGYKIFYLDAVQTSIVGMDYTSKSESTSDLIEELILALGQSPESSSMRKAKPDSVIIQKYTLNNEGILTLDFNPEYNTLTGVTEVLCRTTIVKTLSQVEGVNHIEFTVSGQPLMDSYDKPVGLMQDEIIIHSTYVENVYVTVYFSDETGTVLIPSDLKITYDGNIPIPELIVNRLILGPVEENMKQTIPVDTLLNSITIKEGICYVDMNQAFLNYKSEINPEIVIYSVVNSLVELSYINSVQFTIDGNFVEDYNGIIFNKPFERKLELIKEIS